MDYWAGTREQWKLHGYERNFQPGRHWREEMLVVPVSRLNASDFCEYHELKKVQRFTSLSWLMVTLRSPWSNARVGLAHDAVERPVVNSALTNQDAEMQVEAPGDGEAKVEVPSVIDPKSGELVDLPKGDRYYDSGGTLGGRCGGSKGLKKLDGVPTHMWV